MQLRGIYQSCREGRSLCHAWSEVTYKRCSHEGCTNFAQKGHEGCNNFSQRGGVCITHGAKLKRCSEKGCTKQAQKGGFCVTHGAKVKRCNHEGCTKQAQKGGVCITHGAEVKRCSFEGCSTQSRKGGVCYRHCSKNIKSKSKPAPQAKAVIPVIPPNQLINYEEEEAINSWIWRSTPMTKRHVAINYASGTSSLLQPAPVVSAPSAYDQETDNEIQGR